LTAATPIGNLGRVDAVDPVRGSFLDLLVAREDLDGVGRSRIQYHGDAAACVYAGSEPSMMRELFDKRERPLFRQADPLPLGPLPLDQVLADLAERFAGEGLDPGDAWRSLRYSPAGTRSG
jgi:hypothetical protein